MHRSFIVPQNILQRQHAYKNTRSTGAHIRHIEYMAEEQTHKSAESAKYRYMSTMHERSDQSEGLLTQLQHRNWKVVKLHDDVIKWKHFPRYWPFVRGIHRSLVNSPHKGQWRGELVFSLICAWINGWVSKQSRGWWFETPSRSLWRHCNMAALVFTGDVEACLSQCWLIINAVQWHSLDSSFARDISTIEINLKITYPNFHSDLQGINVLNTLHKA